MASKRRTRLARMSWQDKPATTDVYVRMNALSTPRSIKREGIIERNRLTPENQEKRNSVGDIDSTNRRAMRSPQRINPRMRAYASTKVIIHIKAPYAKRLKFSIESFLSYHSLARPQTKRGKKKKETLSYAWNNWEMKLTCCCFSHLNCRILIPSSSKLLVIWPDSNVNQNEPFYF